MELKVIYDSALSPAQIALTNEFTYAKFLIFDTPNLPDNEGIEIGFVLAAKLPLIGRTVTKDIELPLEISRGVVSSFGVVYIPREYSDAGYSMVCAFNSAISVSSFRVYAVLEDCTIGDVCATTEECLKRIKDLQTIQIAESLATAAIVTNQISQNAALVALATGIGAAFSPYTLGASLAIPPAVSAPLLPGTSALSINLLLPG